MCGICGYITKKKYHEKLIGRMNNTMVHRGPDARNTQRFRFGKDCMGAFGHCRLSVLDLSDNGSQPMWSADKKYCIVYNGEIYNYREIRDELIHKGICFHSNTDTEVLLYAYAVWGTDCLKKLNGMFAFAILDMNKELVFMARDRFGKKPLYYYHKNGDFVFGSELKPLLQFPDLCKEVNKKTLAFYLRMGYFPEPSTVFCHVKKLPPASYAILQDGRIRVQSYWSAVKTAESVKRKINSYDEALEQLEAEIERAVRQRLVADVPVGCFLSSGIDSSLVTAIAQKISDKPVNTYTIGFDNPAYNEAEAARQIAKYLGTVHHEHYLSINDLEKIIGDIPLYYDEPFGDTSMLPSMILSRFAKEDVTVALSGDGGDEIFGGYFHYVRAKTAQQLDRIGNILYRVTPGCVIRRMPHSVQRVIENRNTRISSQLVLNSEVELFGDLLSGEYDMPYFEMEDQMDIQDWQFRRMLLDMETTLPGDMLCKVDRASMSASLEVRSPLLDYKIAELSFEIPQNFKIKGKNTKRILKDLAYRYVPKEILDLPKKGFVIPYEEWMRNALKDRLLYYCGRDFLIRQDIFSYTGWIGLIQEFLAGNNINANLIWNFLMYQMWYEKYI